MTEEIERGYLEAAEIETGPIVRTFRGRSGTLSSRRLVQSNALAMLKRRALAAGLATVPVNHSMRATGVTLFLVAGGELETAQRIANHKTVSTTRLYDRRSDAAAEIERVQL